MKKCCVCNIEKPLTDFGLLKSTKDGHRYDCKDCKRERSANDRLKNKTPKKENYSYPVRTIICNECGVEYTDNFSHTTKFCSQTCRYKNQNKRGYVVGQKEKYLLNNPQKKKQTAVDSKKRNWNNPKNIESRKLYSQKLEVRLKNALRSRIKIAIKKPAKKTRTHLLVGCSIQELKLHIEKQFQSGMTWENWAQFGWHLDHIKPLSSAKNIEEMESLCHYTNLQPLWWRDNLSKSNKIVEY